MLRKRRSLTAPTQPNAGTRRRTSSRPNHRLLSTSQDWHSGLFATWSRTSGEFLRRSCSVFPWSRWPSLIAEASGASRDCKVGLIAHRGHIAQIIICRTGRRSVPILNPGSKLGESIERGGRWLGSLGRLLACASSMELEQGLWRRRGQAAILHGD